MLVVLPQHHDSISVPVEVNLNESMRVLNNQLGDNIRQLWATGWKMIISSTESSG